MSKSNNTKSGSRSNSRAMSSNSSGRARPMVPKAGLTMHRSRYGNGGKA